MEYLMMKNKVARNDFGYLFESEPGRRFFNWLCPFVFRPSVLVPFA
jgi:hypothetical protein